MAAAQPTDPHEGLGTTAADDATRKAAATYNAAADFYDDPANSFWERFGRGTIERFRPRPGARVLDVSSCARRASSTRTRRRCPANTRSPRPRRGGPPCSAPRDTLDQLDARARERVRLANLDDVRRSGIRSVEANVVYALATKP